MKTKKEVVLYAFAAIVLAVMLTSAGYIAGRMDRPDTSTRTTITEYKPVVQSCPQVEECIYNDQYSYKLIRFRHKDGTQCYGIRPYGQGKFESMWCEK